METTTILTALVCLALLFFAARSYRQSRVIYDLELENERLERFYHLSTCERERLEHGIDSELKNLESKSLELLALKDQCYMRKGRAFVKYRDYIATEVLDAAVDFKAYYKLTKKNKA